MHFVQLKVDFRAFSWFCKVLGAQAGQLALSCPRPAEQTLSEDFEDFIVSEQGFGRFYKNLQDPGRILIEFARFWEDFNRI